MRIYILLFSLLAFSCQNEKGKPVVETQIHENENDVNENVLPENGKVIQENGFAISFIEIDSFSEQLEVPQFKELIFANVNSEAKLSDIANVIEKLEKNHKIKGQSFKLDDFEKFYELFKNSNVLRKTRFERSDSSTLIISLDKGAKKILQNRNDSTARYSLFYEYFDPRLNVHVLTQKNFEDISTLRLVNNSTGRETEIWNHPECFTKDKKRFVTLATEQCSNSPYGIRVYSIQDDKISMDFQLNLDDYEVDELIWKDSNILEMSVKKENEEKAFQLLINKL